MVSKLGYIARKARFKTSKARYTASESCHIDSTDAYIARKARYITSTARYNASAAWYIASTDRYIDS